MNSWRVAVGCSESSKQIAIDLAWRKRRFKNKKIKSKEEKICLKDQRMEMDRI